MKTIFLFLFLSISATINAQEQNSLTLEQKQAKTEYVATINKYKGRDLATLPQSARDSFVIASAKNAIFPGNFNSTMSEIEKSSYRGAFNKYQGEPIYTVTFYKDKGKKNPRWTVYVFEKIDKVFIRVHEKDTKLH